jgi:hypothetical protein
MASDEPHDKTHDGERPVVGASRVGHVVRRPSAREGPSDEAVLRFTSPLPVPPFWC